MKDPIQHYFENYKVDTELVKKMVSGNRYVAVMLENGCVGVCATLNNDVEMSKYILEKPDLTKTDHRIALTAYFNAKLNYLNSYDKIIDIFDEINFKKYNNIVMVGYFRSLVKKFDREQISLTIFDKMEEDDRLADMSSQLKAIGKADAVILSGTTIFNNTFTDLIESVNPSAHTYLLGPSNTLNEYVFSHPSIQVVFGSVFEKFDERPLEIIEAGGGTPDFLSHLKKVYIKK